MPHIHYSIVVFFTLHIPAEGLGSEHRDSFDTAPQRRLRALLNCPVVELDGAGA